MLAVESFGTLWFRSFEVFEECGSSRSLSREVILVVGRSEGTWRRSVYFRGEALQQNVCVE
jgi:hypothetical protein